jgi:hypothetical protein
MEPQIWAKSEEKWAYFLVLRGAEISRVKVTGNMLTLKKKVQSTLEALQQGQDPAKVGASSVETLDVRTITKAEVAPGNAALTLHGGGENAKTLAFTPTQNNAHEILRAILAQTGSPFKETKEEISVFEAVLPPAFLGALGGLFWWLIYDSAGKLAAGQTVEAKGRRAGLQRLLIMVAEILGPNGTLAAGAVLLLLIVGWAAMRVIKRPERTVWLPEKA